MLNLSLWTAKVWKKVKIPIQWKNYNCPLIPLKSGKKFSKPQILPKKLSHGELLQDQSEVRSEKP